MTNLSQSESEKIFEAEDRITYPFIEIKIDWTQLLRIKGPNLMGSFLSDHVQNKFLKLLHFIGEM